MTTDIQGMFNLLSRLGINSNDTMIVISIIFCVVIALYALFIVKNDYAVICAALLPLTICSILKFIPTYPYILTMIILSFLLAKRFIGGF